MKSELIHEQIWALNFFSIIKKGLVIKGEEGESVDKPQSELIFATC